ncbi:MAG TPA: TonB-dependent receptor [Longimicrobiales bacterium]|nr:TonB-dependent receptor [Longimicrobiales bacterium]
MHMHLRVHTTITALILGLAAPLAAHAQALRGVVLDDEGRPLAMAQVVALPGGGETLTGSDGRFMLRQLPPGEYRLRVALIGYAPVERAFRIGGGALEPLELRLKPSPLTLGGIQVTATGVARDPSAVTQATSQLSGRALERELSGTVAQTLKYQPGIAVRSNGPAASMPVMRGLTGDRVLVLQDGQRTSDLAGSADDHGVTIDPLAAQRVEVVRGPATLLYGNNALGGVVNVISGDVSGGVPLSAQLAVLAQTESAYPGYALSARALTPIGDAWSVTARGGIRSSDDMRIGDDPVFGKALPNTDARSRNGSVAVTHAARRWTASMAVRGYDFSYGIPVPRGAEPVDLRGERRELTGRTEWELAGAFPSVRADFTVQDYAHDELDSQDVVQQRFELGTRTLNVLVRQATLGPLRDGAWGASVLRKHYAATGPAALTPAADSRTWGVFGFQELSLGIAALQVGARFDRYAIESRTSTKFGDGVARSFDALSGSAGLRVPLGAALSIGITAARSFRAPTVEELFSAAPHAGTGSVEYGDPALDEERGRSFEAVAHLRTARVNGQVAAYHNRVHNYVQLAYVQDTVIAGATLPVFVYAQSPATLRGVEGSLEVALTPHVLAAARGDWLRADRDDSTPLSFMPPPRVGFTLRRDDGRISVGGDVHHELQQHRTGAADEAPTHAHTILRLDGGYRFRIRGRVHSITLRIDNLTNELHREATSRTKDFAPAAGRNIALGYRVVL